MTTEKSRNLSLFALWSLVAIICFFRYIEPFEKIISWDVLGYYLYLPAKFIYHDLRLHNMDWLNTIIVQYQNTDTLYQAVQMPNGDWVMKYPMGLSFMYAPFFFLAHWAAKAFGFQADGFSTLYQAAVVNAGIFYTIIGLVFTRKILLYFFSDVLSALLLCILVLGTNYFQLTAYGGMLSHNFLYTLTAILFWYTICWHNHPNLKHSIFVGFMAGLIIISRPSEMVSVLIFILYGINDPKAKWKLFRKNILWLGLICLVGMMVIFPQLYYWKRVTGHWIFISYTNAGEGFEFLSPFTMKFLFSFRKGWLVYTPIMAFALIGFSSLYKKNRPVFYSCAIYFLVSLYIISSWSTWWYAGGSYSARAILSTYIILLLPMGYFLQWVYKQKELFKTVILFVFVFLIQLNLFQCWQFYKGIINSERMTQAYYRATFGKVKIKEADKKLLLAQRGTGDVEELKDTADYVAALLYEESFETLPPEMDPDWIEDSAVYAGSHSLRLDSVNSYSSSFVIPYNRLTQNEYAWIRSSVMVYLPADYDGPPPLLVFTFRHDGENYYYRSSEKHDIKLEPGKWNEIKMDYMTPEVRNENDELMVYVWHRGKEPVFIDELKVEKFEKKAEQLNDK